MDKNKLKSLALELDRNQAKVSSLKTKIFKSTIPVKLTQFEWEELKNYLTNEKLLSSEINKEMHKSLFYSFLRRFFRK